MVMVYLTVTMRIASDPIYAPLLMKMAMVSSPQKIVMMQILTCIPVRMRFAMRSTTTANGEIDEGVTILVYTDSDGDDYGDPDSAMAVCTPGEEQVLNGDDCDDQNPYIYPDAIDTPADGIDQDCDGTDAQWPDLDGDGDNSSLDCDDNDAFLNLNDADNDGYSTCDGDCNDLNSSIYPGASDDPGDGVVKIVMVWMLLFRITIPMVMTAALTVMILTRF